MQEHDRQVLDELLTTEKTECRKEFMSQRNFYKSTIVGVAAIIGLLGGSVVWALNVSGSTATLKTGVSNNTDRIIIIEKNQQVQYREQMKILTEIKEKVSR